MTLYFAILLSILTLAILAAGVFLLLRLPRIISEIAGNQIKLAQEIGTSITKLAGQTIDGVLNGNVKNVAVENETGVSKTDVFAGLQNGIAADISSFFGDDGLTDWKLEGPTNTDLIGDMYDREEVSDIELSGMRYDPKADPAIQRIIYGQVLESDYEHDR